MNDPIKEALDDEQRQADKDLANARERVRQNGKRNECRNQGGDPDCKNYQRIFGIFMPTVCTSCGKSGGPECKYAEFQIAPADGATVNKPDIVKVLQAAHTMFRALDALNVNSLPLGDHHKNAVSEEKLEFFARMRELNLDHLFDWKDFN